MFQNQTVSIAPMMGYTDRHFRYFLRSITQKTVLYTEMIVCEALLQGDTHRFLKYHPDEHPLVLQLGGSDPDKLAKCAKLAEQYGYDGINLNAGCPSDRVQQGKFGACLMKESKLVAECLSAMREGVSIPVTLKTRIGVDELDSYADLTRFIVEIRDQCDTLIVHARKAWLKGLSPKENRTLPPLQPDVVYRLKEDFPQMPIVINGGIQTQAHIQLALERVDGVMIGRYACDNPYFFAIADQLFATAAQPMLSRIDIIKKMLPYLQTELDKGTCFRQVVCHWLGLFYGTPNARYWRRYLSDHMSQPGADTRVIETGLRFL